LTKNAFAHNRHGVPASILFATPAYGGLVTAPHHRSCILTQEELTRAGIANDWLITWNESLIHRGRMEMVATFLRTNHTHLFWLDADIEFEPAHVAALWNLQADIAVGLYSMKRLDMPLSAWRNGRMVRLEDCPDEPFEVDYAGTGFFLIRREVIEGLYERLKAARAVADSLMQRITSQLVLTDEEKAVLADMHDATAPDWEGAHGRVPALFTTPIWRDGLESEDYHFCRVARAAGYKIIADPSIKLKHWGQYAYGKD
jgi:hypothetical protein